MNTKSSSASLGDYQLQEKNGAYFIEQISSGEVMHKSSEPNVEAKKLYLEMSGLQDILHKIQNEQAEFLRSIMNVIEPFLNIEEPKPKKIIRSDKMCNGCKKFIKIEDIEKHYEECKINCERCNKIVFYKEKLEHYKECKIHCEWCDKEILFCEKYKHKCKKY